MKKPPRISLKNQLLVSMPQLTTPHFHQTVSLICQHDDNGAIGVIVNRLTDHRLGDIFEQLSLPVSNLERAEQPVFEGGPVNPELGHAGRPLHHLRHPHRPKVAAGGATARHRHRAIVD